jgi:hypothetical protein
MPVPVLYKLQTYGWKVGEQIHDMFHDSESISLLTSQVRRNGTATYTMGQATHASRCDPTFRSSETPALLVPEPKQRLCDQSPVRKVCCSTGSLAGITQPVTWVSSAGTRGRGPTLARTMYQGCVHHGNHQPTGICTFAQAKSIVNLFGTM